MDGIRAYWDGKQLLSRTGRALSVPTNFTLNFPNFPIDGELWMGRGNFETLSSLLKSKDTLKWPQVKYYLFDSPNCQGNYEQRINSLLNLKKNLPDHVQIVQIQKCQSNNHLRQVLDEVSQLGGEGLIATEPNKEYSVGRTFFNLKIKVHKDHLN